LSKRVNDHIVIGFLELDSGIPLLIGRDLLGPLFDIPSIEPKVKCELIKVEFYADYSRS
jgi:hypothetical protein